MLTFVESWRHRYLSRLIDNSIQFCFPARHKHRLFTMYNDVILVSVYKYIKYVYCSCTLFILTNCFYARVKDSVSHNRGKSDAADVKVLQSQSPTGTLVLVHFREEYLIGCILPGPRPVKWSLFFSIPQFSGTLADSFFILHIFHFKCPSYCSCWKFVTRLG